MPKKFKGENSKAVVAKARKAAAREEAEEKQRKQQEDDYWRDDDKQVAKKQQRKDDKEKKRLEALERKQEAQRLLEEETAGLKGKVAPPTKVTRADIAAHREAAATQEAAVRRNISVTELPLEENLNKLEIEGEARSVDAALTVLGREEPLERHPEKRMKAAYQAYEDENLPRLKQENPNLRLSQLKQILKKDWIRSPQNPLNQRHASYNEPK